MDQLVCYSLSLPGKALRPDLLEQLLESVSSLRLRNTTIDVRLFAYSNLLDLHRVLDPYDVIIEEQGTYEARLADHLPMASQALREYPLLHRFLNFRRINELSPCRILLVDCDTFFNRDVNELFAKYCVADCYAREEALCRRSHFGYDSNYLDEELLSRLTNQEHIASCPPFNAGVILLNNRVWERFDIEPLLVSYAWRFLIWMAMNPFKTSNMKLKEGLGVEYVREHFKDLDMLKNDYKALQFPSENRWLLDEVSLWLALGHIHPFSYGDFDQHDVIQNGEFRSQAEPSRWVVSHYFSNNRTEFRAWLKGVGLYLGI
jgi:hypothetical protein